MLCIKHYAVMASPVSSPAIQPGVSSSLLLLLSLPLLNASSSSASLSAGCPITAAAPAAVDDCLRACLLVVLFAFEDRRRCGGDQSPSPSLVASPSRSDNEEDLDALAAVTDEAGEPDRFAFRLCPDSCPRRLRLPLWVPLPPLAPSASCLFGPCKSSLVPSSRGLLVVPVATFLLPPRESACTMSSSGTSPGSPNSMISKQV